MNYTKLFKRQLNLIKPSELDFPILIIGAGGIGSWLTLALAKMGCANLTVVDFDNVEIHNVPSQLYTETQIGQPKVVALAQTITELTQVNLKISASKFEDFWLNERESYKVIISAVDSLETRRIIWEEIKHEPNWEFYIDARMGGELVRIFAVSPLSPYSVEKYTKKLFDLSVKASEEPCTARSIVYNTFLCGGLVANLVKKYAKKEEVKLNLTFDIVNSMVI